jgi:release factor glutamine methyltransferase
MTALVAGKDGLDAIRLLARQSPGHLQPGGSLFMEHGYDQAEEVARILTDAGFRDIRHHADLAGIQRVSSARWPG